MVLSSAMIVKIVLIAAAVIAGGAVIGGIVRFAKRTARSAEAQVVREIVNYVSEKGLDYTAEPEHKRLISNMTKVYRPQIERDFPDFDWGETRRWIEEEIQKEYADKDGFTIEETVISRYEKAGASRIIRTESSAFYHTDEGKHYLAVQCELSYLHFKQRDEHGEEVPHALTCPRCGAPLTKRPDGEILCEFCSTIIVGEKSWQITDLREKQA